LNIDINLAWSASSSASEDAEEIERNQHHDHKDHEHGDHARAAAAPTIIITHKTVSSFVVFAKQTNRGIERIKLKGIVEGIVTTVREKVASEK
jgi:hypothetical protein